MILIDANEIKKREHDVTLANGAKHRCFDTTRLYEIPTVDAVPVIRCKDCKHWSGDDDETYCEELGILNTHYNSYCSWAEKKSV